MVQTFSVAPKSRGGGGGGGGAIDGLPTNLDHHERRWQTFSLRFVDERTEAAFIGERTPELAKRLSFVGFVGILYTIFGILTSGSWRSVDAFHTLQAKQLAIQQLYVYLSVFLQCFCL